MAEAPIPRLIYRDNIASGGKSPQAHRPGYDIIVRERTGLLALEGKSHRDVPMLKPAPPLISQPAL